MNGRITPAAAITIVALFTAVSSCRVPFTDSVILMSGTVRAEVVTLSSGTSGEVSRIARGPGDRITAGELLVKLDAADSAGELTRAKKRLADAIEQEKVAKDELDRTTGEVSYSRGRYLTFTYLLKKGAVAPREVDRLKDEWEFAEQQNEKAQDYYARAEAELAEARADIARTESEYGSVLILAPTDGFLTRVMTWEGGYLLKGEEALTIAREGGVYFTGTFEGGGPICLGRDVTVLPLAVPTGRITGYVAAITDTPGDTGSSLTVTVRLFPKSKKDVANIGKTAWALFGSSR
jgi:multidrug resistance efflux pump